MSDGKLSTATINGREVSFFRPPHDEPDFPWVDVEELARAFLPKAAAKRMVSHTQQFERDNRPVVTVRNGNRIATIMCHAMAQGLCAAIDEVKGHKDDCDGEDGPCYTEYCSKASGIMSEHCRLNLSEMLHAFNNPGGPYMRDA